jgi:hypothetical protein
MEFGLSSRMPRWLARIGVPDARVGAYAMLFLVNMAVLVLSAKAGLDSGEVLGWMMLVGMVSMDVTRRLFGGDPGVTGAALPVGGE